MSDKIRADAIRRTSPKGRSWCRTRRVANAGTNSCINENLQGTHGPATNGVRCAACAAVHKRSA